MHGYRDLFYVLLYVSNKCRCQLPEDGEIITPKHVGAVKKIVRINYRKVHLLVLVIFSLHHNWRNKQF